MVKTSGFPEGVLRTKEIDGKWTFDLETIKTIYDPNNRVLITNAKTVSSKNHLWQDVIEQSDYKFVFNDPKDVPTHILVDKKLEKYV